MATEMAGRWSHVFVRLVLVTLTLLADGGEGAVLRRSDGPWSSYGGNEEEPGENFNGQEPSSRASLRALGSDTNFLRRLLAEAKSQPKMVARRLPHHIGCRAEGICQNDEDCCSGECGTRRQLGDSRRRRLMAGGEQCVLHMHTVSCGPAM